MNLQEIKSCLINAYFEVAFAKLPLPPIGPHQALQVIKTRLLGTFSNPKPKAQKIFSELKGLHQIPSVDNIIPYTSTSITLPHLCQGDHGHCIVTSSDGGMGRLGGGSYMLGFVWGHRGWVSYFFYFLFCFCAVVNSSSMAGT